MKNLEKKSQTKIFKYCAYGKDWKKCEGVKNNIGDKSAIPKKVQILNVSNIVHKNIVDKNIVHNFWRGMKILGIYPNVGHSKSGRKLSPRVDKRF